MKHFDLTPRQEELALRIAEALGEREYLPVYRSLVGRFPEVLIRRAYEETLEIPEERVRKSKGAIFNYLVNKYARKNQPENPGH